MCYLVAHNKIQPNYEYNEIIIGDSSIHKQATTKALKSLGDTLNFIDTWLKLCLDNYDAGCDAYVNAMKQIFKHIPQTINKSLTPKQKSPENYDKYWWCMVNVKKVLRDYHH